MAKEEWKPTGNVHVDAATLPLKRIGRPRVAKIDTKGVADAVIRALLKRKEQIV